MVNTEYKNPLTGKDVYMKLGHAGVVAVDPSGRTKYYEFGRYDGTDGKVHQVAVPDLVMDKSGKPTQESLKKLADSLSKSSGKNGKTDLNYTKDADAKAISDYADKIKENPPKWSAVGMNCKSFANEAINAGKKAFEHSSDVIHSKPDEANQ